MSTDKYMNELERERCESFCKGKVRVWEAGEILMLMKESQALGF